MLFTEINDDDDDDDDDDLSRRRWSEIEVGVVGSWRVYVKDRLQVAICEPVEVDDNGDIFGRQRINGKIAST